MVDAFSMAQKLYLPVRGVAATGLAAFIFAASWNATAIAAEPFRIGLIAQPGEEAQVEGLAGIKAAFSSALDRPVEVLVARDYGVLAQAQIDGRIDYAAYSATAYAAAALRCGCLMPVAAPLDTDGAPGLYSVLIIRSEGAGTQGRLAVGPEDSLATRLVPLAASVEARAAAAEGRLVEATSAAEAQAMFLQGDIDGFFGWVPALTPVLPEEGTEEGNATELSLVGVFQQLSTAGLDRSAWRIAWQSALLRYGPHAVRNDLPAIQANQLVELLTGRLTDDRDLAARLAHGYGGGFTAVSAADYKPVEEALGILERR